MKKYIEELTKEELKEVFENNSKLQNDISEDMFESEMHYIGEQLDYVRKYMSDWSIGLGSYSYIKISDYEGFLNGLIEMDNSIPLFTDEEAKKMFEVEKMKNEFYEKDSNDEDYEEIEENFYEAVQSLADDVVNKMIKILEGCYDNENMFDYFYDFYVNSRMDEKTFYIKDDSFELFEEVNYEKSYK